MLKYPRFVDSKYSIFISRIPEYCKKKFIGAFGLDVLGKKDCMIATEYPRNDFLVNFTEDYVGFEQPLGSICETEQQLVKAIENLHIIKKKY